MNRRPQAHSDPPWLLPRRTNRLAGKQDHYSKTYVPPTAIERPSVVVGQCADGGEGAGCVASGEPGRQVWVSGPDMFIGWMMPVAFLGWIVAIAVCFARAAVAWAAPVALCCSLSLRFVGAPGRVPLALSAHALVGAGEQVLDGEHPLERVSTGLARRGSRASAPSWRRRVSSSTSSGGRIALRESRASILQGELRTGRRPPLEVRIRRLTWDDRRSRARGS